MSITNILNDIYISKDLSSELIYFYEKIEINPIKVNKDLFDKFCKRNNIDTHPCILFNFFDEKKIKIAIIPVGNTEFWSGRIYHQNEITSMNDYTSREESTLGTLEKAIKIYKTNLIN